MRGAELVPADTQRMHTSWRGGSSWLLGAHGLSLLLPGGEKGGMRGLRRCDQDSCGSAVRCGDIVTPSPHPLPFGARERTAVPT